ncbi:hypothetical protein PUNSTDRAFT_146361 [Punctularia strigosozonata HHB-11173 SS5]|uniref:Uncharacterized protein n=1 Tax=Punctularia strigosozonata (strain HHB-11173) TaxID=741275 RepID=R7S4K9_PUNST|nr:uncharacterized protein PUNSTDRAFT_146361 [Punctularia strigosozonata HHB-11173 SS5]EIN04717.1 hypothetical protein PUNSTDRAFT_146361 [Punctularia strigosozonata HHB-11173 SS5]
MSSTSTTPPYITQPGAVRNGMKVLQPDPTEYPWYPYLTHSWEDKPLRDYEEECAIRKAFKPFHELPVVFNPWVEPMKYEPPTFYFGWPVDPKITNAFAIKENLAWYWKEDGMGSTWKDQDLVTPNDHIHDKWTQVQVQEFFEGVLTLEYVYDSSTPGSRPTFFWSLHSNYTHPRMRPSKRQIAKLLEDFGHRNTPQWHLDADT